MLKQFRMILDGLLILGLENNCDFEISLEGRDNSLVQLRNRLHMFSTFDCGRDLVVIGGDPEVKDKA